ncbi:hypothetical protein CC77DRAFT_297181 [Alternaria alternata]|uniref:CorA-like transporter domain-containing protein n=2 Tax=Alternaria alternata TaxID=5599 RepID=A0A177DZ80_ALTAL|nr:hypothetical protein CC77DRAFT_297181 [Alternaria alternata]OAG25013.1 hypothetical protein CC77DRAFT_297181 [Alternaria alternata]
MCSKEAMLTVIKKWQISSMLVDVLLKFGDQPQVFQESSGFRQLCQSRDQSFELCYQFMYVERNGRRPPRDTWSFRQTGVMHKFSFESCSSQIVIIHPSDDAVAQSKLEAMAESSHRAQLTRHPLTVHLIIIWSYLANWQDHIESLASDLEQIRRRIDVADISEPDAIPAINPERLQTLRHIEDKIVCKACKCLRSNIVLVKTLMSINTAFATKIPSLGESSYSVHQELQIMEHRLESHINAAETLAQRVQATLGLLTNLLDIGNQANSREISTRILRLTQEGVDDNATVKVITVFTLIYLPASFVASFLGMNLFDFKSEDGSLRASPQFWIFIVTTVPLTMLTVGAWYLYKTRHNKLRKAKSIAESV